MSDRAPYSRIYWALVDDPKFAEIYDVDAHFAAWVRLLMAADAVWPASAHLPASARKNSIRALCEAGLIDPQPGHRYRVRGLDAERRRRGKGSKSDLDGTETGPKLEAVRALDKTSQDETSNETRPAETDDPADAYWQLTGKYPAGKALTWIDNLSSQFGAQATLRALAREFATNRSTSDLLTRTQNVLRAESRELDRREREDEQRRLREKRAVPREEEPWRIEQRKAYLERYGPDVA